MPLLDMLQMTDRDRAELEWKKAQMQYPGAQSSPVDPAVASGAQPAPMAPGAPPSPPVEPTGAPMGLLERLKSEWGSGELQNRMAGVFAGASMNPNKYVMQNSAQKAAEFAADRQQQKQMEVINAQANKTADWLEAQGQKELAGVIRQNPELGSKMLLEYQKAKLKPQDSFSQVRGADLGMSGPQADQLFNVDDTTGKISSIGGGGTSVNVNNKLPPNISPPEKGFQYEYDDAGNVVRSVPIPGSKAAMEIEGAEGKARNLKATQDRAGNTVIQDLDRMIERIPDLFDAETPGGDILAGIGTKIAGEIPRSKTSQVAAFKESVLSNIGIDQLMQMKFNSPTGGALGQVPFQQQQRLEQLLGSLDIENQKPETVKDNALRIKNMYLDTIHGTQAERDQLLAEGKIDQRAYDEVQNQYEEPSFMQKGEPARPQSEEEYNALPKGALFIDPDDGRTYRK